MLALVRRSTKVGAEALASRQQVRLLTTALLNENRVSTSVGGGGRERRNLEELKLAQAGDRTLGNSLDELGTRQGVTPKVARYQERFGS